MYDLISLLNAWLNISCFITGIGIYRFNVVFVCYMSIDVRAHEFYAAVTRAPTRGHIRLMTMATSIRLLLDGVCGAVAAVVFLTLWRAQSLRLVCKRRKKCVNGFTKHDLILLLLFTWIVLLCVVSLQRLAIASNKPVDLLAEFESSSHTANTGTLSSKTLSTSIASSSQQMDSDSSSSQSTAAASNVFYLVQVSLQLQADLRPYSAAHFIVFQVIICLAIYPKFSRVVVELFIL